MAGAHLPRRHWTLAVLMAVLCARNAQAGSFDFWGTEGEYKLTTNYALAMRTKKPDERLINGPVSPLIAGGPVQENELGPGQPAQPATFHQTGLPNTINIDPTIQRLRAAVSIWFSKASPRIAIGIVAAIRYQPIRAFSSPLSSGRKSEEVQVMPMFQRSLRK